mgnify:FL=1
MLKINNIYKSFGTLEVLKGIDLSVEEGEVIALIGPSGTGKSTLLRCINLIEMPEAGTIELDGFTIDVQTASRDDILKLRAKTSMVFQNYNLFKNKTVLQNVMLPFLIRKEMDKSQAEAEAIELLDKVGLSDKLNEFPSRLSGGQQQRVGIARAMAVKPKVMLFDEPTSSLDPELVGGILDIIKGLVVAHKQTMLIVTHEMHFAEQGADRVVFMDQGQIIEVGTPQDIFHNPQNERTYKFLESMKK